MSHEAPLLADTTFESFSELLHGRFNEEDVSAFIKIGKYGFTFDDINSFINSDIVLPLIERQWSRQKPGKMWPERTIKFSVVETMAQTIASLSGNIQLYTEKGVGLFTDFSPEEVSIISIKTRFLKDFFSISFRDIKEAYK